MQIVRAAGDGLSVKPDFALLANSVAIFVGEFVNIWRCASQQVAAEREYAFGKWELVRYDDALIKLAILIAIDQSDDSM